MNVNGFNAELGRQQFLQLMVTQLQHQDPLEPVGQQEFLQQLSQFSVVEGIENLNLQFSDFLQLQTLNHGAELLDQQITAIDPHSGEEIVGRVDEVRSGDGQVQLIVEGTALPLSAVQSLRSAS